MAEYSGAMTTADIAGGRVQPQEWVEHTETLAELREALRSLTRRERFILAHVLDGGTYQDAAPSLCASPRAAHSAYGRALAKLTHSLNPSHPDRVLPDWEQEWEWRQWAAKQALTPGDRWRAMRARERADAMYEYRRREAALAVIRERNGGRLPQNLGAIRLA